MAIKILPNKKTTGGDNIPGEIIKHCAEEMIKPLTKICNTILRTKVWPTQWTRSVIIPLAKKGYLKGCSNYRTISLLSYQSKIMLRIMLNRIQLRLVALLTDEQAGFRKNRNTMDYVFNLGQITERYLEYNMNLFTAFIDFNQAFNRLWHEPLWHIMKLHHFPVNLV